MSKTADPGKALAVRPNDTGYEVGYGKPPKSSQFQKGRSGNPKGRPRGVKNKLPKLNEERLKQIVIEEAYRTIPVQDGKRQVSISMAKAVVRAIAVKAVKGDHRSQRLFSELLMGTEAANARISQAMFNSAIDYKIAWEKEFERCRSLGIDLPDPVPHPHDIILHRDGTVDVKGPMVEEERGKWEEFRKIKVMCDEELPTMYAELEEESDPDEQRTMRKDIAEIERIRDMLGQIVRD